MVCPAIPSYSLGATALIFCMIFIYIMEVNLSIIFYGKTGALFVSYRHTLFLKNHFVHNYQLRGHTSFLVLWNTCKFKFRMYGIPYVDTGHCFPSTRYDPFTNDRPLVVFHKANTNLVLRVRRKWMHCELSVSCLKNINLLAREGQIAATEIYQNW